MINIVSLFLVFKDQLLFFEFQSEELQAILLFNHTNIKGATEE